MLVRAVIESESERIAGRKNAKNPLRTANWWGSQLSSVYYDMQKVLIDRPRLRSKDNKEIQLNTYKAFQNPKKMKQTIMKQMVLGISIRNYKEAIESFVSGYGIKKSSITLTVHKLGVTGLLTKTLSTTNPIESCFSVTRAITGRVKRWNGGNMVQRWTVAALLRAEKKFKHVKGTGKSRNSLLLCSKKI